MSSSSAVPSAAVEDVPIEIQTGGFTRPGIRNIADWKAFNETLREDREYRQKGIKKPSVNTHYFRSRASHVNDVKAETQNRFNKFMDEKKPTILEDDDENSNIPSLEELKRTLYRDDDLNKIRGHVPTPNTYGVTLFNDFVDGDSKLSDAAFHASSSESSTKDDFGEELNSSLKEASRVTIMMSPHENSSKSTGGARAERQKSVKRSFSVKSRAATSMKSLGGMSSRSMSTLTSLPNVDKAKTDKYFGYEAKQLFYSTYHEIDRRKNILKGGCDEMDSVINLADQENALKTSMQSLLESGVLTPPTSARSSRAPSQRVSRATSPDALPILSATNSPLKTPLDTPPTSVRVRKTSSAAVSTTASAVATPTGPTAPPSSGPLTSTMSTFSNTSFPASPSKLLPNVPVGIKASHGESFLVGPRSIERGVVKLNSIAISPVKRPSAEERSLKMYFGSPLTKSGKGTITTSRYESMKTVSRSNSNTLTTSPNERASGRESARGAASTAAGGGSSAAVSQRFRSTKDPENGKDKSKTASVTKELASLRLGGQDSLYDEDNGSTVLGSAFGQSTTSWQQHPSGRGGNKSGTNYLSTASAAAATLEDASHLNFKDCFELKSYLDVISGSTFEVASPRATFLNGCIKNHLPPRAVAVIRRNISTTLNLAHVGIGDVLGILLAKSLASIPGLNSLNLEDNNLTDPGLTAVLNSLSGNPKLEELNIGSNKIDDEAAEALRNYIGNPDCTLRSLHLKQADIDDGECAEFIEALMNNRHLQELDMSYNMLGKDENLNAIYPDLVTGGESLAALIRDGGCPLRRLNLTWNMIRLGGANDLCDSLRNSATLEYLDLSYNALGQEASSILGSALIENKVLTHLILANNGIDEIGAFTLAVGMRENKSLQVVNLDGNPLGEQGGMMLMRVALYCGARLTFSSASCDLKIRSSGCVLKMQGLSCVIILFVVFLFIPILPQRL
jgi:Ran GTPase-activating protein (RanGAP) involved in mRNA processing and transport